jgi:hypothetical protein
MRRTEELLVRRHVTALRLAVMAADGLSAVVLFAGISLWRFDARWPGVWREAGIDPLLAMLAYATAWLTVMWLFGLYRLRARWSFGPSSSTSFAPTYRSRLRRSACC